MINRSYKLLLLLLSAARANSISVPFDKQSMDISLTVSTSLIQNLASHARDCNVVADQTIFITCKDSWNAIGEVDDLVKAAIINKNSIKFVDWMGYVRNPRTKGKFTVYRN